MHLQTAVKVYNKWREQSVIESTEDFETIQRDVNTYLAVIFYYKTVKLDMWRVSLPNGSTLNKLSCRFRNWAGSILYILIETVGNGGYK